MARWPRESLQPRIDRVAAAAGVVLAALLGAFILRNRAQGGRVKQDSMARPEEVATTAEVGALKSATTPAPSPAPEPPGPESPGAPSADRVELPIERWMATLDRMRRFMPKSIYFWVSARLGARFGDEYNWRYRDDEENDRGTPPTDERIAWHAVWLSEAFLPSTIGQLATGVEHLGWWESHQDQTIGESIAAGRSGRGGGWANLPLLFRRTKRPTYGLRSRDRELPDGVSHVTGHIHYLTPSLTVLIVGFRFDETVSQAVNDVLRRRYRTYHEMTGWTSSRVMSPTFQRRAAIRDLERARVNACRMWLRKRFPGYFASGDELSKTPATMLVTTQRYVPFERSQETRFWAHEAGIEFAIERWETGIDGLRYAFRPREDGVSLLAGREADIFADPDEWKKYGHEDTVWSLQYVIDSHLSTLMAFRTVDAILSDSRRRLGKLRDSLGLLAVAPSQRQLSSVQAQLGTMSSDLSALTLEMLSWPDQRGWVLHDIPNITAINDFPNPNAPTPEDEQSLRSRLLDWYVEAAREVRDFESATRSLIVASAEIAGAIENIKQQNFVKWVSALALLVSLAALYVAATAPRP